MTSPTLTVAVARPATNQTILFSGFRDADLARYITERGGVVKPSLTKTVTLVIVKNLEKTTAKVMEAKERGIPIVTLEQFIAKKHKPF
jgi:hypothetical protein